MLTLDDDVRPLEDTLQWVHGPRTVVMARGSNGDGPGTVASMGPRSENRGYALHVHRHVSSACFNGSTVREPWL